MASGKLALSIHRLANPGRFLRLTKRLFPWCAGASALAIGDGRGGARLYGAPGNHRIFGNRRLFGDDGP